MKASRDDAEHRLIRERAAEWVCELQEGSADGQAFCAWVRRSPRHIEEFLFAAAAWKALDSVGPEKLEDVEKAIADALASAAPGDANVVALPVEAASVSIRPPLMRKWWAIAAVAIAVSVGILAWWSHSTFFATPMYRTMVGEQRTVRLEDGSVLYLNTSSRAKVSFSKSGRNVQLIEGEALFDVARDGGRPFRVTAGTTVIQAVGTQFNVRRRAGETQVSVIEGRVTVADRKADASSRAPHAEMLAAGEEATIGSSSGMVKHATQDVADAVAWRTRRLVFRGETLQEIVTDLNRYSASRHFRLEGDAARNRRFAGTFSADDPQALVRFLQQYDDLSVETTPQEFVIRGR